MQTMRRLTIGSHWSATSIERHQLTPVVRETGSPMEEVLSPGLRVMRDRLPGSIKEQFSKKPFAIRLQTR
jgi:hypothetical protein